MENKNADFVNEPNASAAFELPDDKLDHVNGGVLGYKDDEGQFFSPKWGFCWNFDWRDPNPINQSGTKFCYRCKYWDLEYAVRTGEDCAPCSNPKGV